MLKKWLFQLNKRIIWPLLMITIVFLLSGYSLTSRFQVDRIFPRSLASYVHVPSCWVFLILFIAHFLASAYLAVLRPESKPAISIRISRWSAWLLFVSVSILMLSGYSRIGTIRLLGHSAAQIHTVFSFLIIPLFMAHAGISAYYVVRKWSRTSDTCSTRK
ncbi:hypothetical protein FJZ53_01820 [Candidatus Woesearchaeota archaeon]|nr:hypothetical protein [Candidatus Woesearchaeota archaeon]